MWRVVSPFDVKGGDSMSVSEVIVLQSLLCAVIFGTIQAVFLFLNYFNNKKK